MSQTAEFLEALYGDAKGRVSVWWRETPGSQSPYSRFEWFSWPEDEAKMVRFIETVENKDVCVTTTTYAGDHRTPEYTDSTSAIWMDSDTCEGSNYWVAPTWTVQTSPGRWQHFWQLVEPVTADKASELSHRMAIAHEKNGADPSSWPRNKLMRMPGAMNTSHGFPTRVTAESNGTLYSYDEVFAPYAHVELPDRELIREIPELAEAELPDYSQVIGKLNAETLELVTSEVKESVDRSRLRYKILLELFRSGLSYEEALSVAWRAPASRKWSEEDPRGLSGLAAEAVKAMVEAGTPRDTPLDPFGSNSDFDNELAIDEPVVLLNDEDRKWTEDNPCFIDRYLRYAHTRDPYDNDPFHRANAVTLLSLAYLDAGFMPSSVGEVPLNLFVAVGGETTSGKSSSFKLLKLVLRELFHDDPEFNIGGNASESALIKTLHGRDGRVSFFNSDEAQGVLKTWTVQDWTSGMREKIAELYEGTVPPILRSAKGESVTTSSKALLVVYLMGTLKGIMEQLTPELFESGFIPRFVFHIGNPVKTNYDSYRVAQNDGANVIGGFDPEARQIAAQLSTNRIVIRDVFDGKAAPIRLTPDSEAEVMLRQACWTLDRKFKESPNWDMIRPALIRWRDSVLKLASLLAIDRRSTEVNLDDMRHALKQGEEWFTNVLRVITRLSAGAFQRSSQEVYNFIVSRGGKVTEPAVYRRFPGYSVKDMTLIVESLKAQGRLNQIAERGKPYFVADTHREEK